jgi:hypothetical protein
MHCSQAVFGGAGAGQFDHLGRGIHSQDCSRWADQPCGDKRYVTRTAPDIEHPHARSQPSEPQRMLGVIVIQPSLQEQPLYLHVVVAQDIRVAARRRR